MGEQENMEKAVFKTENVQSDEDNNNNSSLQNMTPEKLKSEIGRILVASLGSLMYAFGVNVFMVPNNLYTGGIMGYCQLIRTILSQYAPMLTSEFDISGMIYFIVNMPLLILARKRMGKWYLIKTLICIGEVSFLMSVLPIPVTPIIDDLLSSALISGIICGCGIGLMLTSGACDGGMEIVGILLIRIRDNFSVGKANLIVNVALYAIMLFLFSPEIVIYSLIYASILAFAMDQMFAQNINVEVHVITRNSCAEMDNEIFESLGRGMTKWKAVGAYTHDDTEMLFVIINKFELNRLKRIVKKYDPQAFIVATSGVNVEGHFIRHLS